MRVPSPGPERLGAVRVTVIAALVALSSACGAEPQPDESAPTVSTPMEVRIPTANEPATVCELADIHGRLVEDARWGVALADATGNRSRVVFPFGYRAVVQGDRVAIQDETGRVVARTGDIIDAGGGHGNALGVDQAYIDCGPIEVVG